MTCTAARSRSLTDPTGRTFDVQMYTFGPPAAGPETTAPTNPAHLRPSRTSATTVTSNWTASTDDRVASYATSRDGAPLASAPGNATSFTDTTVVPARTYRYSVSASDLAGNRSPDSNVATVTTPSAPLTYTFTPTDDAYVDQTAPSSNFGAATRWSPTAARSTTRCCGSWWRPAGARSRTRP